MKQTTWKIIYHNYQGLEKKAVDFLSKEAGRYLIRENDLYRIYVLPCEKVGAKIEENAFIVGLFEIFYFDHFTPPPSRTDRDRICGYWR